MEALYYGSASPDAGPIRMRWFIEVSRIGENTPAETYCVEAKQWQAALQDARKLRGDVGPLSKFTIELMDDGYRAVDPTLRVRYIVNKAPRDAPLTAGVPAAAAKRMVEPGGQQGEAAPAPAASQSEAPPRLRPSEAPPPAAVSQSVAPPQAPRPRPSESPPRSALEAPRVPRLRPSEAPPALGVNPSEALPPLASPRPADVALATESGAVDAPPPAPATSSGDGPGTASEISASPPGLAPGQALAAAGPGASEPLPAAELAAADVPPAPPAPPAPRPSEAPPPAIRLRPSTAPPPGSVPAASEDPAPLHPPRPNEAAPPDTRKPSDNGKGAGSMNPPAHADIGSTVPAFGQLRVPDDVVPPATLKPPPKPFGHGSSRPLRPVDLGAELARQPDFQLFRKREEEPTSNTPITYREYAYAVKAGTDRKAAEVLIWARFKEIAAAIEHRPKGKFVQIAVFDHIFESRPLRAPLATLAWKDWRGDPSVQFPAEGNTARAPGPDPSARSQAAVASAPISVLPAPIAVLAAPAAASTAANVVAAVASPLASAAVLLPPPMTMPTASPPAPAPFVPAPAEFPLPASAPSDPAEPAVISEFPPDSSSVPRLELVVEESRPEAIHAPIAAEERPPLNMPGTAQPTALFVPAPAVALEPAPPSTATYSGPLAPPAALEPAHPAASIEIAEEPLPRRRRRSDEDLIGELFETMHDLHFMADLISGAEFVLRVLQNTLPCELTVVHVFDINTRQFVVVRASGPGSDKLLLHRTSDQDPLFDLAMRRIRALSVDDADADPRYRSGRWEQAATSPKNALCGAVQQNGRYLGAIEVINPDGGGPFHDSEVNALDYICEQFAEFVASRPIILDAEIVLGGRPK